MCQLLRNVQKITSTTDWSFCLSSVMQQQLHSSLCACCCAPVINTGQALKTNSYFDKWSTPVVEVISCTFFIVLLLLNPLAGLAVERVDVGNFSSGILDGWEEKVFKGKTHYQLVSENLKKVLRADSQAGASGLVREIKIDLNKTPILNWSWRVDNQLKNLNERLKSGDDYAARIYIVVSGGFAFWKTRSLNYVWASKIPVGSHWPNAFAKDNVIMIAQQSGPAGVGQWHHQQRNIQADLKRYFGEEIDSIDAVAIMTDTDNSGQKATAWYGDIFFTSK